jgi:hypothetical protein
MIDDTTTTPTHERVNDYSDVSDMFRTLAELEADTAAHRRQRDAIIEREHIVS